MLDLVSVRSRQCYFQESCKKGLCQFRHDSPKSKENSYASENCDYKAKLEDHLYEHFKAKHAKFLKTSNKEIINTRESKRRVDNESDDSESELEELECDVWEQIFTDDSQLSEHRAIGECGFECEDCGVGFKHESQLKSHEEKHCT